ncbi:hypothetical protein BpHYR1_039307 [Brachionus plicatilis]|uniref:Uncharacterized protein n=1 Tax=Brachionus plicatilis TaxID=10195 RepID=A0A3M7Q269_BRAPC|nr:hypothetical protein BpHYR1_039307 [Brachionus plicatilis]
MFKTTCKNEARTVASKNVKSSNLDERLKEMSYGFFQGNSERQSLLFSPHGCNMIKICSLAC